MTKHDFKIGDKVKLKDSNQWGFGRHNPIGIIVGFDRYIRVTWESEYTIGIHKNFPHFPNEIERIRRVGEQLLFNFMN